MLADINQVAELADHLDPELLGDEKSAFGVGQRTQGLALLEREAALAETDVSLEGALELGGPARGDPRVERLEARIGQLQRGARRAESSPGRARIVLGRRIVVIAADREAALGEFVPLLEIGLAFGSIGALLARVGFVEPAVGLGDSFRRRCHAGAVAVLDYRLALAVSLERLGNQFLCCHCPLRRVYWEPSNNARRRSAGRLSSLPPVGGEPGPAESVSMVRALTRARLRSWIGLYTMGDMMSILSEPVAGSQWSTTLLAAAAGQLHAERGRSTPQ